ncbi:hypothetical protein K505DRAFT_357554 [Melanomma pulvis-pyrius CBS 109.77]|uniref:Uncharacterized protein n=1 Tax=Melanomma pulvis-pyrius CBS 109.77 TaxID=1314802 RepID=A0A6A6XQA8_9PLEO|nr:hypothetical protein K505DRAFT_357554 [Melanomma pulvis-pyrius CBS 109.77]
MAKKKRMHPPAYYANPNPGQGQKFYMTPDLKLHPISSPMGGAEDGGDHGDMPPWMLPDSDFIGYDEDFTGYDEDFTGYDEDEDNWGWNHARLHTEEAVMKNKWQGSPHPGRFPAHPGPPAGRGRGVAAMQIPGGLGAGPMPGDFTQMMNQGLFVPQPGKWDPGNQHHDFKNFGQQGQQPVEGLFGAAGGGDIDQQQDFNNFGHQNQQPAGAAPKWAQGVKNPLDGWGIDNLAAPKKKQPAGGLFGAAGGNFSTKGGGENFSTRGRGGGNFSTKVGGGGNFNPSSRTGGMQTSPIPQDEDDPLFYVPQNQQQNQQNQQASSFRTAQSTYRSTYSTVPVGRTTLPNTSFQHQIPPVSPQANVEPPTNITPHPKGDNRFPPPGTKVPDPIWLETPEKKYWYRHLLYNKAFEVEALRTGILSKVHAAWQKYKAEKRPDTDLRLIMLQAEQTTKVLSEISNGRRGKIYLLQKGNEYVAGCAIEVDRWMGEMHQKDRGFKLPGWKWGLLGVGEKEIKGCYLLIKETL